MRATDAPLAQHRWLIGLAILCAWPCAGCDSAAKPVPGAGSGNSVSAVNARGAIPHLNSSHSAVLAGNQRSTSETEVAAKDQWQGPQPRFRMLGAESGLDFQRYDDMRGKHRILEANGGGVAVFDADLDGYLDLFFTDGSRVPEDLQQRIARGKFFQNQRGTTFVDRTGLTRIQQSGYTCGCAVGDYDNDGFEDLYITAFGANGFWRNNGDGTFSDFTSESGTAVSAWSTSAAFADLNGDGNLDLYVVNYLQDSATDPRLCPNPASPDGYEQCPPAMYEAADDVLFYSDGAGKLLDVSREVGIAGRGGKGLGVVIGDWDGNGRPEIYVANDGEANFLWVQTDPPNPDPNASVPRWDERALESGVALSEAGYAQASMGIAAADFDGNGLIDLFIANYYADTNILYANHGHLLFEDVTRASRIGPPSRSKLGFGTIPWDYDNDGWFDLFVANGHVDDRTWLSSSEPYHMQPLFHGNRGDGTFQDLSAQCGAYFQREWLGRGVAGGDLNRDGKWDAVVSHQLAPSVALLNETGTEQRAVTLRLIGTQCNRTGYGAVVTAEIGGQERIVVRELTPGISFQSSSSVEVHIGIGHAEIIEFKVRWPSGTIERFINIHEGYWQIVEGQSSRHIEWPQHVHQ